MNYEQHDDLDRMLFALPLEEPPADLRSAILAATVYRPAFPVKAWEATLLGVLVAICVWLGILIARGGADAFMQTVDVFTNGLSHVVVAQNTWLWMSVGGGVAYLLMILNLSPIRLTAPRRFSRR